MEKEFMKTFNYAGREYEIFDWYYLHSDDGICFTAVKQDDELTHILDVFITITDIGNDKPCVRQCFDKISFGKSAWKKLKEKVEGWNYGY